MAGCALALRAAGLWDEAAVLGTDSDWAARVVQGGQALTVACGAYPRAWRHGLGRTAPPAVWVSGCMGSGPWVSVVGSRQPVPAALDAVAAVVSSAASIGFGVASGGAAGVDQAAARAALGATPVAEVLPCGLARAGGFGVPGTAKLSLCAPGAGFSAAAAMERNSLLYALGTVTVVVQPRLGQGGTWAGAVAALRRRRGTVVVWSPSPGTLPSDAHAAIDALVRLGALPLSDITAGSLQGVVAAPRPPAQASLFGDVIREAG